ncbi:MAG: Glucuronate isomerase [Proteiniphilum acetatigenes]|uniref:Uronate isomerase n=1 Tax=Proteiniphilum acetatigenes TaxID=294710 RepID=A0A117M184_9BACT|nr:MAG: Glucuronate isomerase [Proteiniphilum acetatigenes]
MNNDLFFSPDPIVRKNARDLYESIKDLPLLSPHGHTEARWFAENTPFENPTDLIITPDHYIFRMLFSRGISLDSLRIPRKDGSRMEGDPRDVWRLFAKYFYLFAGTPTGLWIREELRTVFETDIPLNEKNADLLYDHIDACLKDERFRPRSLYERFNLELLSTTNGAAYDLSWHENIARSGWKGCIVPCFRPDDVTDIGRPDWLKNLGKLGELTGENTETFSGFLNALRKRREDFINLGCNSTDHGVKSPWTHRLSEKDAATIYTQALRGKADDEDQKVFAAHMLMMMAEMSTEDGLVMQIHPGVYRNHDQSVYDLYGGDRGADIPVRCEYTRNLKELLNAYGSHPNFKLVVYTLDETTYTRELAPLAGYYPAMLLGPAWWFNDSFQGMKRFKQSVVETAGFYNITGFVDDTRALPSIPVRHDFSRRIDADYLAHLMVQGILTQQEAEALMPELAYGLTKKVFNREGKLR